MRRLVGMAAGLVVAACGQKAATSTFPPDRDANVYDGSVPPPADAPFPCGDPGTTLVCAPDQFCVIGCTDEGPIVCSALLDSGACPQGSVLSRDCSPADGGFPCEEAAGPTYPTVCVDSLDAAICPGAGIDPSDPPRTVSCSCTL